MATLAALSFYSVRRVAISARRPKKRSRRRRFLSMRRSSSLHGLSAASIPASASASVCLATRRARRERRMSCGSATVSRSRTGTTCLPTRAVLRSSRGRTPRRGRANSSEAAGLALTDTRSRAASSSFIKLTSPPRTHGPLICGRMRLLTPVESSTLTSNAYTDFRPSDSGAAAGTSLRMNRPASFVIWCPVCASPWTLDNGRDPELRRSERQTPRTHACTSQSALHPQWHSFSFRGQLYAVDGSLGFRANWRMALLHATRYTYV